MAGFFRITLIFTVLLGLSACSKEDHIEKCVQAGLKVWEDSQAFKKQAELKATTSARELSPSENKTGFIPAGPTEIPQPEKRIEEPDTKNKAEFRLRSHCLNQASGNK
jgi:hypothetical protein